MCSSGKPPPTQRKLTPFHQNLPKSASFYTSKTVFNLDEYDVSEIDRLMAMGYTKHQATSSYIEGYNEDLRAGRTPKPVSLKVQAALFTFVNCLILLSILFYHIS